MPDNNTQEYRKGLKVANVRAAVAGAVYVGDVGVQPPTPDAFGPVSGLTHLGYISEDGLKEAPSTDSEEKHAFQDADVVRTISKGGKLEFEFALIETKKEVLELYYNNKIGTDGGVVIQPTKPREHHGFVIDIIDGDEMIRTVIPDGALSEVSEQEYKNGELIEYGVKLLAYPSKIGDDAAHAKKFYKSLKTGKN